MTDPRDAVDAISRAATDLIPQLVERLERHGLGEIEVSHGDLRLRVAGPAGPRAASEAAATAATSAGTPSATEAPSPPSSPDSPGGLGVASPAVGFFMYAGGLGPGLPVEKGDPLGHVEMLGVRHDVRAPRRGTVRHLVAESGEAVEYGQVVVELEPAEVVR
ncbi:MAG TPA: biotin/lipoyl-containing protein [Candidatus Limnocylindria bacterium]